MAPDTQGFATKEDLALELKGSPWEGKVRRIVACAGFVKVWADLDPASEEARGLKGRLESQGGVKVVTLERG